MKTVPIEQLSGEGPELGARFREHGIADTKSLRLKCCTTENRSRLAGLVAISTAGAALQLVPTYRQSNHPNIQQTMLAGIIIGTAVNIVFRSKNQASFYRVLMDVIQFLTNCEVSKKKI